jgi:outer membrane protein assembly factor BamB
MCCGVALLALAGAVWAVPAPTSLWDVNLGAYVDKPTVADLDGSGRLQVVAADDNGRVQALGGANGAVLWTREYAGEEFRNCPIVADVDGSGAAVVIVGGSTLGVLACLNGFDGSERWRQGPFDHGISGTPCLVDLGPGRGPAVIIALQNALQAYRATDGKLLWETPLSDRCEGCVTGGPLGGRTLILVGTVHGKLLAFDEAGQARWEAPLGQRVTKPALLDDRPGEQAIYAVGSHLARLDADGHERWRWNPGDSGLCSSPALGDLRGDGNLELVITGNDGRVYGVSTAGKTTMRAAVVRADSSGQVTTPPASTPVLADLQGRGGADVMLASAQIDAPGIYAFDGRNGHALWRAPLGRFSHCCPVLADLVGDGNLDVVCAAANGHLSAFSLGPHVTTPWAKFGGGLSNDGELGDARAGAAALAVGRLPFPTKPHAVAWADKLGAQQPGGTPPTTTAVSPSRPDSAIAVRLDGRWLALDPAPVEFGGRVMVPLRGISEAFKATVKFDAATKTITITRDNVDVVLRLGVREATIGGTAIPLDLPPQVIGDSTYVPLRFVASAFGCTAKWVAATQDVELVSGH